MSNRNQPQGNRGMPVPPAAVPEVPSLEVPELSGAPEAVESGEEMAQKPASKVLEVVATRKGFFGGKRREMGEVFSVPNEKMLGAWMRLTDPKAEKLRQDKIKEMKAKKLAGK